MGVQVEGGGSGGSRNERHKYKINSSFTLHGESDVRNAVS